MDFAGSNSVNLPSDSEMMHQVKAELATAYAQEFYNVSSRRSIEAQQRDRPDTDTHLHFLSARARREPVQTVRQKCFKACITSPSSSLSSSERTCLERCVDRYVEATQVVSQSAIKAMQGHS